MDPSQNGADTASSNPDDDSGSGRQSILVLPPLSSLNHPEESTKCAPEDAVVPLQTCSGESGMAPLSPASVARDEVEDPEQTFCGHVFTMSRSSYQGSTPSTWNGDAPLPPLPPSEWNATNSPLPDDFKLPQEDDATSLGPSQEVASPSEEKSAPGPLLPLRTSLNALLSSSTHSSPDSPYPLSNHKSIREFHFQPQHQRWTGAFFINLLILMIVSLFLHYSGKRRWDPYVPWLRLWISVYAVGAFCYLYLFCLRTWARCTLCTTYLVAGLGLGALCAYALLHQYTVGGLLGLFAIGLSLGLAWVILKAQLEVLPALLNQIATIMLRYWGILFVIIVTIQCIVGLWIWTYFTVLNGKWYFKSVSYAPSVLFWVYFTLAISWVALVVFYRLQSVISLVFQAHYDESLELLPYFTAVPISNTLLRALWDIGPICKGAPLVFVLSALLWLPWSNSELDAPSSNTPGTRWGIWIQAKAESYNQYTFSHTIPKNQYPSLSQLGQETRKVFQSSTRRPILLHWLGDFTLLLGTISIAFILIFVSSQLPGAFPYPNTVHNWLAFCCPLLLSGFSVWTLLLGGIRCTWITLIKTPKCIQVTHPELWDRIQNVYPDIDYIGTPIPQSHSMSPVED
jgi:hypothetical protein